MNTTHIVTLNDSGYASGLSSPALSDPSLDSDDLERTPRPRAPSPLTPITPDFAFPPVLPQFFSPYKDPVDSLPVSPTIPECIPVPTSCQDKMPEPIATGRTHQQPSKPAFIKTIFSRRRVQDLYVQVPDMSQPHLTRTSLDGPRTASFLDFKDSKRLLRRQNSEDLLSARKAASVDDLELESFLIF